MKTIKRIIFAAVLALVYVSCSKSSDIILTEAIWGCEYDVQTENGTTGEMEDHTGYIILHFSKNGMVCVLEKGISGMMSTTRISYEVRWSGENCFDLYDNLYGKRIHDYSGEIEGNKLTLKAYDAEGNVSETYELTKY